jgi:large subunit ribosomal protein L30
VVGRVAAIAPLRAHDRQPQREDKAMPASRKSVRLVDVEQPEAPEVVVPSAVTVEAPTVPSGPQLRITLLKSGTGYKYDQKRTLAALGLRRLHSTVVRPDNASVRGMLTKVQHLVYVEEIGQS